MRAFLGSALGTGLSRVLGALRDVVIASFLGASLASDAFWIAFLIPNLFRRFVADEGLTGALIPALAKAETEEGDAAMRELASSTLGVLVVLNLVLCGIGILFPEPLVLLAAWSWGDDPEKMQLAATMTRWLIPFTFMVSLVSYFEGLLNHRGHFFAPKLAPGLVSAGMVAAVLFLGDAFEEPVYALVAGVLGGGIAHILVNVPPLISRWGRVGISLRVTPRLRAVLRELGKVVLIGIFAQLNILVLRQIASFVGEGSITYYHSGTRITDLAQGIVAVAIGSALLPNLAGSVATGSWDRFRSDLTGGLRLAMFLLVPVAVALFVWAEPITAILFRVGKYTWADVQITAATVRYFVPFLLAVAAINIIKRVYHALDDRTTLLVVGAIGVALTGGLGVLFVADHGVPGLALGLSIATALQLLAYLVVLRVKLGSRIGLGDLPGPLLRITIASLPIAPVLRFLQPYGRWTEGPLAWENWAVLVGGTVLGGLVYFGLASLLRLPEVSRLTGAVFRRVR